LLLTMIVAAAMDGLMGELLMGAMRQIDEVRCARDVGLENRRGHMRCDVSWMSRLHCAHSS
jgi:hypothetical protein